MISTSIYEDIKKVIIVSVRELKQVTYIQYFIIFQENITQVNSILNLMSAFFNSDSEINVMRPAFAKKLGFAV